MDIQTRNDDAGAYVSGKVRLLREYSVVHVQLGGERRAQELGTLVVGRDPASPVQDCVSGRTTDTPRPPGCSRAEDKLHNQTAGKDVEIGMFDTQGLLEKAEAGEVIRGR